MHLKSAGARKLVMDLGKKFAFVSSLGDFW